jgi:hypothetical protein
MNGRNEWEAVQADFADSSPETTQAHEQSNAGYLDLISPNHSKGQISTKPIPPDPLEAASPKAMRPPKALVKSEVISDVAFHNKS